MAWVSLMPFSHLPVSQKFASYGGALMVLAIVFTSKAASYAVDDDTLLRHVIEQMDQDWVSPMLWGTGAVVAWAAMFSHSHRLAAVTFGMATTLLLLWGALTLWSGFDSFLSTGSVYIGFAVLALWGVTRTQIPVREMKDEQRKERGEL